MEEEKSSSDGSSYEPNADRVTFKKEPENKKKSSSELFNSVFPSASKVEGKDSSSCDILGPYRKEESPFYHSRAADKNATAGYEGDSDRMVSRTENPKVNNDTCNFSSSLYYGGPDLCSSVPVPNSNTYASTEKYKKEVKDDSGSWSTGEWWEGSLYY